MAQLFGPRSNGVFRLLLVGAVAGVAAVVGGGMVYVRSPGYWKVGEPAPQPIPFRHDIHAGTLGLDCRYCHAAVERAASAGMPSAGTCLACHAQVWSGASVLEPLRTSAALGTAIRWSSVHRLPAHAYFHHGIHVAAGVACSQCHGRVETMERTVKVATMSMGWCLECHRSTDAARGQRPSALSVVGLTAPADALHATVPRLTDCSTCHR